MIFYHTYLFQLELYEPGRYLRTAWRRGRREWWRKSLDWTNKLVLLFGLSLAFGFALGVLFVCGTYLLTYSAPLAGLMLLLYALLWVFFLQPLFLVFISALLLPLDWTLKTLIIRRAARKIRSLPRLTIVGIAGSYGKTTVKEAVSAILKTKFKTVNTPGNVNTLLGVARVILNDIRRDTEVFVMEMGEHYPGDIKALAELAPPAIGIITGINEAHLDRFRSLENLIATNLELLRHAKPGATIFLNADSSLLAEHFTPQLAGDKKVKWYSARGNSKSAYQAEVTAFHENGSGFGFRISSVDFVETFRTRLLGEYAMGAFLAGILVAKELGMAPTEAKAAIAALPPVPHRLETIRGAENVLVIDDSYNGNPEGVREAIKALSRFTGRRKLFLTPGLVETGVRNKEVHTEIGRELASVADAVILIKNSATPFIAEGLKAKGFPEDNIYWFDTAPAAHAALKNILHPGDAILFQNDWTDNYL